MKKFTERNGQLNLSEINREMLEAWEAASLFEQSMEVRRGAPSFVFYEGPPSANGMPGIHHVMARTIKDIFCRSPRRISARRSQSTITMPLAVAK